MVCLSVENKHGVAVLNFNAELGGPVLINAFSLVGVIRRNQAYKVAFFNCRLAHRNVEVDRARKLALFRAVFVKFELFIPDVAPHSFLLFTVRVVAIRHLYEVTFVLDESSRQDF